MSIISALQEAELADVESQASCGDPPSDRPLPPEFWPNIDHLVTEDGEAVDGHYSEKQMRLLTEPLFTNWHPGHPFLAAANVALFFGLWEPPIVPDVMVSKDVAARQNLFLKANRSYLLWEHGKPPEAAIEIVSNKEGGEITTKPGIYARAGVPYYVVWDPNKELGEQKLRIFGLRQQEYEPMEVAWFPRLGLGLKVWHGNFEGVESDWLRWCDQEGNLIPTGAEQATYEGQRADQEAKRAEQEAKRADQEATRAEQEAKRADQEATRAEQEAKRADQEATRADEAVRRAEKLAEQLRALGMTPQED